MKRTNETVKPHLSSSQLDLMSRCGEAWRRRYIEGDRRPPAVAMMTGKAYHATAEVNMHQKIDTHTDLPVDDIIDCAVQSFHAQTGGDFELSSDEQSVGRDKVIGTAVDQVARIADAHAQHQAPLYQPILVEHEFRIELEQSTHDVIGFIDLVAADADDFTDDSPAQIVDFKKKKMKPTHADAADSNQLAVYGAAMATEGHELPIVASLDCIVDRTLKSGPKTERHIVSTEITSRDMTTLANRVDMATSAIAAGVFMPAMQGSWWCSPDWCGYWSTCKYVNAERRAQADAMKAASKQSQHKLDRLLKILKESK